VFVGSEDEVGEWMPERFYAQVIITVTDHAPLLANPRQAHLVMATLADCAPNAPGQLWGYVALSDSVRLIVGPTDEDSLAGFIELIKAQTAARLLAAIRRADDESLDMVLRYNPVWGGAIYQVWQAGSHRVLFWTEYKLSNAVYELRAAPVLAGLVESADEWPYLWVSGDEA